MPALVNPDVTADAKALLDSADIPHGEIVSIDRDSILFRGPEQGVYTAWLHCRQNGQAKVILVEDGFVATEPVGLHPAADNYGLAG